MREASAKASAPIVRRLTQPGDTLDEMAAQSEVIHALRFQKYARNLLADLVAQLIREADDQAQQAEALRKGLACVECGKASTGSDGQPVHGHHDAKGWHCSPQCFNGTDFWF